MDKQGLHQPTRLGTGCKEPARETVLEFVDKYGKVLRIVCSTKPPRRLPCSDQARSALIPIDSVFMPPVLSFEPVRIQDDSKPAAFKFQSLSVGVDHADF
ncbi:hypothetical protein PGTUg99_007144 [Puccinia graminis f. sp. tritici]|uniref:Uncharacterized protein n=1 Tax=Puccinia graminis f. sp. tritici TaxID=56615 RepID=A0A5B0RYK6_PUCGR|nr:hypothetical protein PGTUg99_007144 [Puccinia graminis f. sp. tritici]